MKVVDFGISALVGEHVDRDGNGIVQGTPGYVAPERLLGAPVGAAADVYALGVVLFQALTGRLPFDAVGETEILAAHLTAQPDALPPIAGMPGRVNDLYLRCLAKDPGQRPDARELTAALSAAAGLTVATIDERGDAVDGAREPDPELTTLLPSAVTAPIATDGRARVNAGPGGSTRPLRAHRRRLVTVAVLPLALVAGVLYAATTEDGDAGRTVPQAGAADPACAVTYRVGTDDGARFTGTLTFRQPQSPPPDGGWTLSFDLPADQRFRASAPAASTQSGDHVVVRIADGGTSGGGPVVVPFTGSYHGANPLPDAFVASGHRCTPLLLGPNATPAAPSPSTSEAPSTSDAPAGARNGGPSGAAPAGAPAAGLNSGDDRKPGGNSKAGMGPKPGGPKPGGSALGGSKPGKGKGGDGPGDR